MSHRSAEPPAGDHTMIGIGDTLAGRFCMRDRDGGDLTADSCGGGGEVCTVVVVCFPNDQCRVKKCLTGLVIASRRTRLTHRQNDKARDSLIVSREAKREARRTNETQIALRVRRANRQCEQTSRHMRPSTYGHFDRNCKSSEISYTSASYKQS
jgi:hypothetical protein